MGDQAFIGSLGTEGDTRIVRMVMVEEVAKIKEYAFSVVDGFEYGAPSGIPKLYRIMSGVMYLHN